MAVKRRSNWYIYFIAFGVALAFIIGIIMTFSWYLFPEAKETTGLTSTGELADNFRPDKSHNFTLVTMLSDESTDIPELFMIMSYNAVENTVVFIPVPKGISVSEEGRDLSNVFEVKGGNGVLSAVSSATGLKCDAYVSFNRESFMRLVSSYGNVKYNIPKTLIVKDGEEIATFNAGELIFSPESLFRYVYFADFGDDEGYRFNIIADIYSELLNQNLRYTDSSLLDNYYKIITEHCDSSVTEELYLSKKAAILNTITYASAPAEYYIPYGEYGEDGSFTLADNSRMTISQKCGQDE
ncbi:MAG: hypothetical protein E7485_06750 [Ruminococcaceae bacterium]|nr:hypothetical protein [Oscillospiraceae bacterium]